MSERSMVEDLKLALDESLQEAERSNDVKAKALALHDMARALFKAGLPEMTARVVEKARRLTAQV